MNAQKTPFPILAKFGEMTDGEVDVMVTASAESGSNPMAEAIAKQRSEHYPRKGWPLTVEQALWLGMQMAGDAGRVAEACGDSLGAAFERAGNKLYAQAKQASSKAA